MESIVGRMLVATASCVALICVALPVFATHTADHASDEIWGVADQAEQDMADVVSDFEARIGDLESEAEVDVAAEDAKADIETIWDTAMTTIQNLVKLYPGVLGQVGGSAKQQVQEARQASRSLVSDLVDAWAPPAPTTTLPAITTTTTTTPTTTTTEAAAETVNEPAPPSPGSNNGGGPPQSPGSSAEAEPVSTPRSQPVPTSAPGQGPPLSTQSLVGQAADTVFVLAAQTPDQPIILRPDAISESFESNRSGASAKMAAVLATVLPPAVVDLVLSPLLILEILLRTTVDDGSKFLGPLLLLGVFAIGIFVYDRSTKRGRLLDRI